MPTTESIRKHIKSTRDLRDIVKTMRTLSAVNIRHFARAVESLSAYDRTIEMGLQIIVGRLPKAMFSPPKEKDGKGYVVVFGSDQGLCGGFNDQIVSHALNQEAAGMVRGAKRIIASVGERATSAFEARGIRADESYPSPGSISGITPAVQQMVMNINELQIRDGIDTVTLFYHRMISNVAYRPHSVKLLPIDSAWIEAIKQKKWPTRRLPAFSMNRNTLFSALIRQYIFVSLYRAFAESMASENAARLSSMQSAEKNIEERLEELQSDYRSERQNAITSELLDIVSGYEALK